MRLECACNGRCAPTEPNGELAVSGGRKLRQLPPICSRLASITSFARAMGDHPRRSQVFFQPHSAPGVEAPAS